MTLTVADIEKDRYQSRGLLPRYRGVEVQDLKSYDHVVEQVDQYLVDMEKGQLHGDGLVLYGPPGSGKTLLAHVVICRAIELHKDAHFVGMADYLDQLKEIWTIDKQVTAGQNVLDELEMAAIEVKRYRTYRFLALDDAGKEYKTEWAQSEINKLIRYRGDRMLPTIITTNIDPENWAKAYSESFADYLEEVCRKVWVYATDVRRDIRAGG